MSDAPSIAIVSPPGLTPPSAYGRDELARALRERGIAVDLGRAPGDGAPSLVLVEPQEPSASRLPKPGRYSLTREGASLRLEGRDANGVLYGCLDLAEAVLRGSSLDDLAPREFRPSLDVRGILTFRFHETAERDWAEDPEYWREYADQLARWRYNRFTMVFGHQSPYLIPIYSFLLDDVSAECPDISVEGITPEERERQLGILRMSAQAMASRGITFILGIWNTRPWSRAVGQWMDHPTRVRGTNDVDRLAEQTRRGFAALMRRCPEIDGIQLRMNGESGITDQRFFVRTYARVIRDLAGEGRTVSAELRNWRLEPPTIAAFAASGAEVVVSTKYFAEHMGMPYQPPLMRNGYSYDSLLRKDKPYPFLWQVWGLGSHRLFNWGDPEYARRLARSCHLGDGAGFEISPPGSQKGFSQWGEVERPEWRVRRDLPPSWDFERYWFFHMAFGRAGYDTDVSDEPFLHELGVRTSPEAASAVLEAYRAASQVVSYLISQRMDDENMYVWPELDAGGPIDHHAIATPGERSLFSTPREHAARLARGEGSAKVSPFQAAADLDRFADEIDRSLESLGAFEELAQNLEIRTIRTDFAALSALSRFHAAKSRATGSLELFYAAGDRQHLDEAKEAARTAARLWDDLCDRTADYADVLHLGPSGGHWRDNRPRVQYDLRRIARVREFFDRWGLFGAGFDFGASHVDGVFMRLSPRFITGLTGLDPEPRFTRVDVEDSHAPVPSFTPARGFGWINAGGLRAWGNAFYLRDTLWGVHHVAMAPTFEPSVVDGIPLDGLRQSYVGADRAHVFRVDLADGDYEVIAIAPELASAPTAIRAGDSVARVDGDGEARLVATATDGRLDIEIGSDEPWVLAGIVVRPVAPLVAHLAPQAAAVEDDLVVRVTATAPGGVDSVTLLLTSAGTTREQRMRGDGTSFEATVDRRTLASAGEAIEYAFVATGRDGLVTRTDPRRVPIVRGFVPPTIATASAPETWSPGTPFAVRLMLDHGENAREVRVHYREADQNANFRAVRQPGGTSGTYAFDLDTSPLDEAYELIWYVEVVDAFGRGSFFPDPFQSARYFTASPG